MIRRFPLRRLLVAGTALAAAGGALAHPGHANPGPWADLAHYAWHLAVDMAPLAACIGVALLLRAGWRAHRAGAADRRSRPGRD